MMCCYLTTCAKKCPKIQFKTGSLPSCLSCVDTILVCPLILVPFLWLYDSQVSAEWFNKKVQGLGLKRSQYPKENCDRQETSSPDYFEKDYKMAQVLVNKMIKTLVAAQDFCTVPLKCVRYGY